MRNTPKGLNEELNRMKNLINFSVGDHSHDVLSEQNINESVPFSWTYESALNLHKKILSETLREVETIKEQKEESDDVIINDLLKSVSDDFGEDKDGANGFMEYMFQYLEKLAGDSTEEEVMSEQYLVDTKFFKYWRKKWKGMVKKIKYSNLWDKLKGSGKFKKYLNKVKKNLGRKWKNFTKKVRRNFTKQLKSKWVDGKSIDFGYANSIKIGKYKPSKSHNMDSSEEFVTNADKSEWESILNSKEAKKMIRKMSKFSKNKWGLLTSTEGKDEEQKNIDTGFAVAAVEYFVKTNPKTKWKTVVVGRDKDVLLKHIPIEDEGEPDNDKKIYPVVTQQVPKFDDGDNYFIDNAWCPEQATKLFQSIDKSMEEYKKIVDALNPPEGQPKCVVKSITIVSSCSRYRNWISKECGNTGPFSFDELAKKRLETMKDYVWVWLNKLGAVKDTNFKETYLHDGTDMSVDGQNITLITNGSNGDGSRGPNPPAPNAFVSVGKGVSMTDDCNSKSEGWPDECEINGKLVSRDEAGAPHSSDVDYDQYRFVKGIVQLVFNDTEGGGEDEEEDKEGGDEKFDVIEVDTVSYPIAFYAPGKHPFELKFPTLRFNFKKGVKDKGGGDGKDWGSTECEAFGG